MGILFAMAAIAAFYVAATHIVLRFADVDTEEAGQIVIAGTIALLLLVFFLNGDFLTIYRDGTSPFGP